RFRIPGQYHHPNLIAMFQKILVAEDVDSTNIAVVQALQQLNIAEVHHTQFCDDAVLKIRKANALGSPYELLVTDLSFKDVRSSDRLSTGEELIMAVRKDFPAIKI